MKAKIVAAALGVGMVVGSLVGGMQVDAAPGGGAKSVASSNYGCNCETKITTTNLNLREGPSTSHKVLYVMPKGLKVQAALGSEGHQNGFVHVSWDSGENYGWASEQYLADEGTGGGSTDDDGWEEGDAEITGVGVTTSRVNFREGPGTNYGVQFVVEDDAQIALTDVVVNGYRNVWHAGYNGWIADQYIGEDDGYSVEPGSYAKTTSNLNLRQLPNTGSKVLLVIPSGEAVLVHAETDSGFRTVTYNGITGWAYESYLS